MVAKKSRTPILHQTEIMINRSILKDILDNRGLEYTDLYHMVVDKFGLDLSYKGFMSVIAGQATWKLLYAYAISDVLDVEIKDIFDLVPVDVDKMRDQKEHKRSKYQTN